jgi:hypothetical protein
MRCAKALLAYFVCRRPGRELYQTTARGPRAHDSASAVSVVGNDEFHPRGKSFDGVSANSSWPTTLKDVRRHRDDLMDSDDYAADTSRIDLTARANTALFTMPGE